MGRRTYSVSLFLRNVRNVAFAIVALVLALSCLVTSTMAIAAGIPTTGTVPTILPTSTATSTATATATPTSTPTVTPTVPVHVEAVPTHAVQTQKRHRRRVHSHPNRIPATPTAVTEPTDHSGRAAHPGKKHSRHKRGKATARPSPTAKPTATPLVSLSTEDSIKPVTCKGSGKALATHPFLLSPFRGWTSIVSYFDHDSPNFLRDGQIIVSTGLVVNLGSRGQASDFPAYWSGSARQYIYYDGHNGYDFNLWYQPVFAAAAGKVIFAAYEYPQLPHSGYGQMVMIDHRNGYVTLYGHFSHLEVRAGQKVRAGQEIGISGNSGHSSGPHLHFTVFHNCSPTDPYGWSGSSPDPLANYEGETSVYLWKHAPLVDNPLAGLSGNLQLPAGAIPRLLLLKLPTANHGTAFFTAHLRAEIGRVLFILKNRKIDARADMLRGAVAVTGRVAVSTLYSLPDVLSAASLDQASDARADVLLALSHAALATPHHDLHIGPSHAWTGYLVEWQGQTLLVGKGPRARHVRFRISKGSGGAWTGNVRTDARTGTYILDLGRLSSAQRTRLSKTLTGTRRAAQPALLQPIAPARPASMTSGSKSQTRWPWLGGGALLLLAVLSLLFLRFRHSHAVD